MSHVPRVYAFGQGKTSSRTPLIILVLGEFGASDGQRRTWPLQKQQDFTMKTPSKRPKQNKLETTSWFEHRSIITNSMVHPPGAQVRMNDPHQAGVNGQRRTWRKDIGATSEQYLRWEETWLWYLIRIFTGHHGCHGATYPLNASKSCRKPSKTHLLGSHKIVFWPPH